MPSLGWKLGTMPSLGAGQHGNLQSLEIANPVAVKDLAALLGRKPFEIIADLIELKVMASVDQSVTFELAARVALKYGFIAKRAV